jgi:tRNA (mo5U34)-methyltransferase
MDIESIRARVGALRWFHDYEVVPGVRTGGVSNMDVRGPHFPVPQDLTGKRVLDIGCADGYFTYLCESRGAEVTSIDLWPRRGYFLAHELRESKAEFRHMSVYDLDPAEIGLFDVVFFCGVYYHNKHPLLALERVASVSRGLAIIESEILPEMPGLTSGAQFLERDTLNGDPTNWWVPLPHTLAETVRAAGFPHAEVHSLYGGTRAVVRAEMGPRTAGRILDEDLMVTIDRPRAGDRLGEVEVSGWALSQLKPASGVTRIRAAIDHPDSPAADLGDLEYGRPRADLMREFGDAYAKIGFGGRVDTSRLTPGEHTLFVIAEGPGGWNYRAVSVVVAG